jgi:hypothetical protein
MKTFRVYLTPIEDPYVEIKARSKEDALQKVANLYDDKDSKCFTYSGHFTMEEVIEVGV